IAKGGSFVRLVAAIAQPADRPIRDVEPQEPPSRLDDHLGLASIQNRRTPRGMTREGRATCSVAGARLPLFDHTSPRTDHAWYGACRDHRRGAPAHHASVACCRI